jgi:hypothetical protein
LLLVKFLLLVKVLLLRCSRSSPKRCACGNYIFTARFGILSHARPPRFIPKNYSHFTCSRGSTFLLFVAVVVSFFCFSRRFIAIFSVTSFSLVLLLHLSVFAFYSLVCILFPPHVLGSF